MCCRKILHSLVEWEVALWNLQNFLFFNCSGGNITWLFGNLIWPFSSKSQRACPILWHQSHSSPRLLFPKDLTPLLFSCPNSIQPQQPLLLHLHSRHQLNMDYRFRQLQHSSRIRYLYAYSGIGYWALPLVEPTDQSCQTLVLAASLSTLVTFLERLMQLADHQSISTKSLSSLFLGTSEGTQHPIHYLFAL